MTNINYAQMRKICVDLKVKIEYWQDICETQCQLDIALQNLKNGDDADDCQNTRAIAAMDSALSTLQDLQLYFCEEIQNNILLAAQIFRA